MCGAYNLGGKGTVWYLNPENYAAAFYQRQEAGSRAVAVSQGPGRPLWASLKEIAVARREDPVKYGRLVKAANQNAAGHPVGFGQVLPLKDGYRVLELAYPMALTSCLCRRATRGVEETSPEEYSCMRIGVGTLAWEQWPERYKGGVYFPTLDEAKAWLEKWDKRGLVHIITTSDGHLIDGLCNCDYPDCLLMRHRLDYGVEPICLKSHYVARVDYGACDGCLACAQRCQFEAIRFEATKGKPMIDAFRCYGCGLCETGCPQGAISLVDRMSRPSLRGVGTVFPTIEIDATRCLTPFDCKRCLEICPQAVFQVTGVKFEEGRETDPREPHAYRLEALFMDKCSMCGDCVEVCSTGALSMVMPGVSK
ncbi:MAG: 4Fe-4S dicluster domain-containing protein [Chloroflexota bacterium]